MRQALRVGAAIILVHVLSRPVFRFTQQWAAYHLVACHHQNTQTGTSLPASYKFGARDRASSRACGCGGKVQCGAQYAVSSTDGTLQLNGSGFQGLARDLYQVAPAAAAGRRSAARSTWCPAPGRSARAPPPALGQPPCPHATCRVANNAVVAATPLSCLHGRCQRGARRHAHVSPARVLPARGWLPCTHATCTIAASVG